MMGRLSDAQLDVVTRHVRGERVTDYGAGNLTLARLLLALGAEQVMAVEKDPVPDPGDSRLTVVKAWFEDCEASTPVAFVSWPINRRTELHALLEATPLVIYLGSNLDGDACGYPLMYRQLARREVLDHVPGFRGTLVVYGPRRLDRAPLPEEDAGICIEGPCR